MDDTRHQLAIQALARYWQAHPQAADTVEGMRAWWIPEVAISTDALAELLAWLESRRVVVASTAVDGRVRYALADPARTTATGALIPAEGPHVDDSASLSRPEEM
ncbi:hypothetical protein SAMN02745857_00783 [Andreprevotia lacus DSM 23236]|jgi:hypothetical protein|uniref:Uncharacterized protein n=1 Tax=Andreprevotia lacus DSM 23236 TaxID=1121001 RepID=A0A1W1X730_9NEIS|nr:hypothetical protein [Andreprevotia lacus]SMC19752.1 hypothetical protein SAMN02745857_00783 [Andreprevotia lacus DSM 23236]